MSRDFAEANVFQRALRRFAASGPGSWLFARILDPLDRLTFRATKGRHLFSSMLSALPVAMVTTTGARSGQSRTVPLLALPTEDGLAIIGSNYGQPKHPAWRHNLRANPEGEVDVEGGSGRSAPSRWRTSAASASGTRRCAPTPASPATRAAPRPAGSPSSSSTGQARS